MIRWGRGLAVGAWLGLTPAVADAAPTWVEPSRGEVYVDAAEPTSAPRKETRVHGAARLGVGFGFILEDPMAALVPGIELDFRQLAPVQLELAIPFRLRMVDREPEQSGVLRRRDFDEVGDYFAWLRRLEYSDAFAVGARGVWAVDLRAGMLGRVELGHGSIVRGYHNSLDIDRSRAGADVVTRATTRLLDYPAELEAALVVGDLAMSQIIGARLAGRWAGAGLGLSAVGDPTAPRQLQRDAADAQGLVLGDQNRLQSSGRRGVSALGLDLSYRATDDWRWLVMPYLDLAWMPNLGGGMHLGLSGEGSLGRRRQVHLGATAELTMSSSGYDPAYFDVFYLAQRWQAALVGHPSDRPADLGAGPVTKYEFARRTDLRGVGGYGALRFAHDAGGFAELGYHMRPGPLGHTSQLRTGVELRKVDLAVLLAHRGRHGFEFKGAGSLARIDLRVPVLKWMDVEASLGWLFAIRPDEPGATMATGSTGLVTSGGLVLAGVAGRVPW